MNHSISCQRRVMRDNNGLATSERRALLMMDRIISVPAISIFAIDQEAKPFFWNHKAPTNFKCIMRRARPEHILAVVRRHVQTDIFFHSLVSTTFVRILPLCRFNRVCVGDWNSLQSLLFSSHFNDVHFLSRLEEHRYRHTSIVALMKGITILSSPSCAYYTF